MSQILIINFKRLGDIISTGNLADRIKKENPNREIALLCFRESYKAAEIISSLDSIYTIDRRKYENLMKNPIYNKGFAIQSFHDDLKTIKSVHWNRIINLSNDEFSSNVATYLNPSNDRIVGTSNREDFVHRPSSDWDIVLNDIQSRDFISPITFEDTYAEMCGIKSSQIGSFVDIPGKHLKTAKQNCDYIRSHFGKSKIIGLSLTSSNASKDLPKESILELISLIREDSELFPLLVVAPNSSDREWAQGINESFAGKLVIAEADLKALPSLLKQLDLFIAVDSAPKHIAQAINVPTLELSLGFAPFSKQGVYRENSAIISRPLSLRNFIKKTSEENIEDTVLDNRKLPVNDIIRAAREIISGFHSATLHLSEDSILMRPIKDTKGTSYLRVDGGEITDLERTYLLNRMVTHSLLGNAPTQGEIERLGILASKEWIEAQKQIAGSSTRTLLGTLRNLKKASENSSAARDFIFSLEELLTGTSRGDVDSIPICFFQNKVDTLEKKEFTLSLKEMENLLYELKTDFQSIFTVLKEIESTMLDLEREGRIKEAQGRRALNEAIRK